MIYMKYSSAVSYLDSRSIKDAVDQYKVLLYFMNKVSSIKLSTCIQLDYSSYHSIYN